MGRPRGAMPAEERLRRNTASKRRARAAMQSIYSKMERSIEFTAPMRFSVRRKESFSEEELSEILQRLVSRLSDKRRLGRMTGMDRAPWRWRGVEDDYV